jgi:thiol-disulfide isomerase/thioredoxin
MNFSIPSIPGISRNKLIIGSIVILAIVGGLLYYFFVYSKKSTTSTSSSSSSSGSSKQAELMLFYVDWCPHCKTAKPVWDELKNEYQNKTINGYNVLFTEINCTTETAEIEKMISKYNIEGYPTIKLLKDGQIIEYDAKPTKDTLVQFLNTAL